jgi:uncharacterized protein YdiU (UPF0061 family)
VLDEFPALTRAAHLRMACAKIGIAEPQTGDAALVQELYNGMQATGADHTNTFAALQLADLSGVVPFSDEQLSSWHARWKERISATPEGPQAPRLLMQRTNPAVIPRNHVVEQVLDAATFANDLRPLQDLLTVLATPYTGKDVPDAFRIPPPDGDAGYRTFCGT